MISTHRDPESQISSFRNVWKTFLRRFERLESSARILPEDDRSFTDLRDRLLHKIETLADPKTGLLLPNELKVLTARLKSLNSLIALSDAEHRMFRQSMQRSDKALDEWFEKIRRKDGLVESLERSSRSAGLRVFAVIVSFLILLVLFVVSGLTIYFKS